ncbi:MAG TPA: MoaD/ThiS family protein [Hyphomonas sp.]|nr:MoaD/ThiS family protein [Hyphomonas sp.]MCC0017748.1 MoaD/ThiS family protein [Rhodobiaceae bacterium]HPE46782.1 MoaD/ThiS family protein [Hyphomonas sp.]
MAGGRILFFGKLSDLSGDSEWPMPEFAGTMDEGEFIELISGGKPELSSALKQPSVRVCVNQAIVPASERAVITSADEVAFLPPMSGG